MLLLCEGDNRLLPETATVFFLGHHRGRYGFLRGECPLRLMRTPMYGDGPRPIVKKSDFRLSS